MNRICDLFGIKYPVIQGGMVWCSGWRLASAVSNAGGLGLIGAGSMHPEVLREHIQKCKKATDNPFGVNVPLMYPEIETIMNILVEEGVKIVFTSAGSPKKWTGFLKKHDVTVVHVVSSALFAAKCEEAGVDAIVAKDSRPEVITVGKRLPPFALFLPSARLHRFHCLQQEASVQAKPCMQPWHWEPTGYR